MTGDNSLIGLVPGRGSLPKTEPRSGDGRVTGISPRGDNSRERVGVPGAGVEPARPLRAPGF